MGEGCRVGSVVGLEEQPSRVAPNLYFWRAGCDRQGVKIQATGVITGGNKNRITIEAMNEAVCHSTLRVSLCHC